MCGKFTAMASWAHVVALSFLAMISDCGPSHGASNSVRVKLGSFSYEIPTAFGSVSTGGIDAPKGGHTAILLKALMPSFVPVSPKNQAQFDKVGWHDQVRMLFDYRTDVPSSFEKNQLAIALADPLIDVEKPIHTPGGFAVFTPKAWPDPEVWTKRLPNGGNLVMQCSQNHKSIPFPSCTILEHWHGFLISASFSKKYADQAVMIDEKAKALLVSLRR